MVTLSTITILMGAYALYHAFTILFLETTYAVVLLGMIIPNMIGDVQRSKWNKVMEHILLRVRS